MIDMTPGHVQEENKMDIARRNILASPPWGYFCNVNMHEIIPGLFLGSFSAAQFHSLTTLREKGIRYIICVRQDTEAHFIKPQVNDPFFTYLTLDIADHETENILRFFPKVNRFIDEALSKNFKILVHGNNGNSRSATLVSAYIMEKFGLAVSEALRVVKAKRPTINPNEGFKAQLSEYEPIYKARQDIINGGSSSSIRMRPKRQYEQLCETGSETCAYDIFPPPPSPITYEGKNICPTASEFSNHLYKLLMAKR